MLLAVLPQNNYPAFNFELIIITSSFTRSATSPSFAYVSNPVPDSSLCRPATPRLHPLSCCSPIASIRFNCCSPFVSASAAVPRLRLPPLPLAICVRFSCCSPIVSTSAAAPRLRPLQLLFPDCIHFDCCSPITSACSPSCSGRFWPMSAWVPNILEHSSQSSRFSKLK